MRRLETAAARLFEETASPSQCHWRDGCRGDRLRLILLLGLADRNPAAEDFRVTLGEVTDLGADRVLATVDRTFKGKSSEIQIAGRLFSLVSLRGGLIVRMHEYADRSDALEAVGLSEQDAPD